MVSIRSPASALPIDNLRIHHNTFDGIEDHGVCNQPGVTNFSFTHNTVVVKKDMNVLNIGGANKPGLASNVTITNNLFVKEGTPPCAAPIMKLHGGSTSEAVSSATTPSGTGRRMETRRWSQIPCWNVPPMATACCASPPKAR